MNLHTGNLKLASQIAKGIIKNEKKVVYGSPSCRLLYILWQSQEEKRVGKKITNFIQSNNH